MTGKRKWVFYWLPVFLWAALIFHLSSQTYQQQDLRPVLHKTLPEQTIEKYFATVHIDYAGHKVSIKDDGTAGFVEFFIRKAAHLSVYFVLGVLFVRAFFPFIKKRHYTPILSLVLCFLYAGSDEIHQFFTGDRTPMFADVLLDSLGSLLGIIFCYSLLVVTRKKEITNKLEG